MLETIVAIGHVFLAAALIGLILLQRGKGAEAGAAFGAGASGTVFGAAGSASFLSRTTAVLATLFFVTSLSLAYLAGQPGSGTDAIMESLVEQEAAEAQAGEDDLPDFLPMPGEGSDLPVLPQVDEEPAASSEEPDEPQP